jgi:hypothetical protein
MIEYCIFYDKGKCHCREKMREAGATTKTILQHGMAAQCSRCGHYKKTKISKQR